VKTAFCLQHVPFEGPGVFESALARAGYSLTRRLVPADGLPSDPGDFLLVMGGPMSVNDPDPWIAAETEFIRRAVKAGVPCLGICLGSQFIAKAAGGRVYKGPGVEIGITPIDVRNAAPFDGVPSPLPVFEWHGEGIELPPKATILASSALFPVQAFRVGARAMGLLFHLEIEETGIESLCRECPEDVAKAGRTADAVLRDARPHLPASHRLAERVIESLC
jgi:GMP synthase (glutamine-hydrolysing)